MEAYTQEELAEALRAIHSLISKCEKVAPKLAPGSAQASLLRNRIKALRIAAALIADKLDKGQAVLGPFEDRF